MRHEPLEPISDKFDPAMVAFVAERMASSAYSVMPIGWYNPFAMAAIEAIREWDKKNA